MLNVSGSVRMNLPSIRRVALAANSGSRVVVICKKEPVALAVYQTGLAPDPVAQCPPELDYIPLLRD